VKINDKTRAWLLSRAVGIQSTQKTMWRCETEWLNVFWNISRAVERSSLNSKWKYCRMTDENSGFRSPICINDSDAVRITTVTNYAYKSKIWNYFSVATFTKKKLQSRLCILLLPTCSFLLHWTNTHTFYCVYIRLPFAAVSVFFHCRHSLPNFHTKSLTNEIIQIGIRSSSLLSVATNLIVWLFYRQH